MQKGLCIIALSIAVVVFILFAADLALGMSNQATLAPFKYENGMIMDIVFIVVSGLLAGMSWVTLREQV